MRVCHAYETTPIVSKMLATEYVTKNFPIAFTGKAGNELLVPTAALLSWNLEVGDVPWIARRRRDLAVLVLLS